MKTLGLILRGMSNLPVAGLALALAASPALAAAKPAAQKSSPVATPGRGRYDQHIEEEVNRRLKGKKQFKNITASVEDGVVTLRGTVDLFYDKMRAERKAHEPAHVEGVRNQVEVRGPELTDTVLAEKIANRLRYDRIGQGIMFNALTASVQNGVAIVGGTVRSEPDRASALAVVETTPGVKNVVDEINVAPLSPMDDELRVRLARAIYGAPTLSRYLNDPQAPIRIVVEHGHVTLAGVVGSAMDKQIAGVQANGVPGVFSVDNQLIVAGKGSH